MFIKNQNQNNKESLSMEKAIKDQIITKNPSANKVSAGTRRQNSRLFSDSFENSSTFKNAEDLLCEQLHGK